ncbi:thump domain-containing protein [Diplodia corticola]|uniref:Thump domain-containing protein n=1 Tax=Diplodia corticola TaxID=236234 RepID=A0A1J9S246_9PEZI|nr:thump domain-containing protein [Diplodia corticola]OJD34647.1 thump domain-containing protein [Diplodia corticola]
MPDESRKRKASADDRSHAGKRSRGRRQWRSLPAKQGGGSIEPGDSGIWATCNMGREAKAVAELRDMFDEHVEKMYGGGAARDDDDDAAGADVEAEIAKELEDMRKPAKEPPFRHIRVDTDCIMFFKTKAPIEPVEFVRRMCEDAMASSERKTGRFIKRLTPMTLMGKAHQNGLEEVAAQVLAPHFHAEGSAGKKFAIRPNIRNNKDVTRDQVIKTVASAVGPGHSVDLKDYDLLILVDVYKGLCGMSVVGKDFERLKRYNLSEIYEPSPKEQPN